MSISMNEQTLTSKALSKNRDFKLLAKRLKKLNPKQLDKVFQKLHSEVFAQINCLECANCCRGLGPRILARDIQRVSANLKMKTSEFVDTYLRIDEDGDYVFKSMPCPFLLPDNHCIVYPARPKACREYPHTDQENIKSILPLCIKNTETCPAVYEIFTCLQQAF